MSSMSDYLEAKDLDHVYNKVALTSPDTYLALFTSDPTDADSGTEVSGGSYARQLIDENGGSSPTWSLAATDGIGKEIHNLHVITFPTATAAWGTVTHFGIYDAVSGGNLLDHGAWGSSQVVNDGGIFEVAVGDLVIRRE